MKVIISRKGFDSKFGGGPSPIVDGEWLVSLPIVYGHKEQFRRFDDLRWRGQNLGKLIEQLYPRKRFRDEFCHHDPDLRLSSLPARMRHRSWRPLFGQAGAAASHLQKQNVGEGDVFLFFGLFRKSEGWKRFARNAPMLHVIHGWLQVEEVITNPVEWAQRQENRWARNHPHTRGNWWGQTNLLFIGRRKLQTNRPRGRKEIDVPGAGVFERFDPRLQLSASESTRKSVWCLPASLTPDPMHGRCFSFLERAKWTNVNGAKTVLMDPGSTTLWQEAVISGNRAAYKWALELITAFGGSHSQPFNSARHR